MKIQQMYSSEAIHFELIFPKIELVDFFALAEMLPISATLDWVILRFIPVPYEWTFATHFESQLEWGQVKMQVPPKCDEL